MSVWEATVDLILRAVLRAVPDATDDEAIDELRARLAGRPLNVGPTLTLIGDSWARAHLAQLRVELGLPAQPVSPAPSRLAREKIPEALKVAAEIRGRTKRPAPVSTVADRIGIDRGTLKRWIADGWLDLNPG